MSDDLLIQAKRFAARSLAKKSQPSTELRQKLLKKGFSDEIASEVIRYFFELGILNDEEWLMQTASSLVSRGYGALRVRQRLSQKGISREVVDQAIQELAPEKQFHEQIQHLLKTRYKNVDLSDYKQKQKVIASLARRGFSIDIILDELRVYTPSTSKAPIRIDSKPRD